MSRFVVLMRVVVCHLCHFCNTCLTSGHRRQIQLHLDAKVFDTHEHQCTVQDCRDTTFTKSDLINYDYESRWGVAWSLAQHLHPAAGGKRARNVWLHEAESETIKG